MTATPTPGDLSARHVEVLAALGRIGRYAAAAGNDCLADDVREVTAAIAALSALPAAGGEVVDCWLVRCRRTGRIFWSDPSRSTAEGYARQIAHRMPDNTLDTEVIPLYAQGAK